MFKPQKPQGPPQRHKLPLVERPPKQEDIATLFTGALRIRGTVFEMPIRPSPMSPLYLITCKFDHGCNETIWAMYEGSEAGNQLFSLPQSDLDMVFDMVCMSCGSSTNASMPAELAPDVYPATPIAPAPAAAQAPAPAPGQAGSPFPGGQPQQPMPFQGQPGQGQYFQGPPGQPYPPAQGPYAQPSGPYPPQQTPYAQPAAPFPGQQGAYPNQFGAQPAYPPNQMPYEQSPYGGQGGFGAYPPPGQAPSRTASSPGAGSAEEASAAEFSNFIDLLNKGSPNLLLGHLFVESGIMPERCLEAALKLQEMVRKGRLTNQQAIIAMKRAAELGGNLDEDIIEWAKDPDAPMKASRSTSSPPKPAAAAPAKDNVALQRIAELLKQAGLVSDEDLETARRVKSKHGGEISQILVSAGRLNSKTVEAAAEVQNLVAVGRLRIDKAITALHYCERMRVGLKEALTELSIEVS